MDEIAAKNSPMATRIVHAVFTFASRGSAPQTLILPIEGRASVFPGGGRQWRAAAADGRRYFVRLPAAGVWPNVGGNRRAAPMPATKKARAGASG